MERALGGAYSAERRTKGLGKVTQSSTSHPVADGEQAETPDGMAQLAAHRDPAYHLARWLVGNENDADDIVQEAYVRAFRYLHNLRAGESRPWLLRIVRNASYDYLRRDQGVAELCDENWDCFESNTPNPEVLLERKRTAEALREAVEELPTDLRQVLILREWSEMPYKEIAAKTGVASGTVMSRLWRARQQLPQSFGLDRKRAEASK